MSDIKLLLINTIGLTGADLLLPKLSSMKKLPYCLTKFQHF